MIREQSDDNAIDQSVLTLDCLFVRITSLVVRLLYSRHVCLASIDNVKTAPIHGSPVDPQKTLVVA